MTRRRFVIVLGWFGGVGSWLARTAIGQGRDEAGKRPGGTDRFGDPLPPGALARFGTTRLWHAPGRLGVESLAFSPDGRLIASAGMDPPVVLWDSATGREVRRLGTEPPPPEDPSGPFYKTIGPIAFSPDGASLAVGRAGGRIERWGVATGRPLPPFDGHRDFVVGLAYSRDGKILISGDETGVVLVRDVATGRARHRLGLEGRETPLAALALSADGSVLATTGRNGPVTLWDAGEGRRVRTLDRARFDYFADRLCLAVSPDGATVARGGKIYQITLWDARTGAVLAELAEKQDQDIQEGDAAKGHSEVAALSFAPDGGTLASAGRDDSVRIWDVAGGRELRRLDRSEGEAEAVAFAPDGRSIAATGPARTIRLWDVATGREQVRESVHRATVSCVAFAPDGRTLTSVGGDGAVCFSDPETGRPIARRRLLPRICYTRALSRDGKMLAYQGLLSDRRVFVVSTETGEELRRIDWRDSEGGAITTAFSHDGKTLILGDSEDETRIAAYDLATGAERWRLRMDGEFFDDLIPSPDGRTLATRWGRTIILYDTPGGKVRRRLEMVDDILESITAVAFAPDGASLATGHRGGTVRHWDVATGRELGRFVGPEDGALYLAFAPDGKVLATAGSERSPVKLLDVATVRELARLEGHREYVFALAFSPDGRRLASGGSDTTAIIWDVATRRR